jgi:hypothetical protein
MYLKLSKVIGPQLLHWVLTPQRAKWRQLSRPPWIAD